MIPYLKPYLPRLIVSLLLSVVSVILSLYIPILIGNAVDLIGTEEASRIPYICTKIAFSAVGMAAAEWLKGMINNSVSFNVLKNVRDRAFAKIQKLPFSFLDKHPTGDVVNRIIADADGLADGIIMGLSQFFTGAATIAGAFIFMMRVNYKVGLVVAALTPISLFTAKFITSRTYSLFKKTAAARGELTAFTDEMIANQHIVKAFGYEERQNERFFRLNDELRDCSMRSVFYSSLVNPTTRFVNNIIYAAVVLFGAILCTNAAVTVGALSALLAYVNQYTKPFNEISGVWAELENSIAGASRLFALIDEQEEISDNELPVKSDFTGEIDFNNVEFSYDKEKKLIQNFDLHVKPGQKIALVGQTGCGKTTMINLLMRFYDSDSGEIIVDGDRIDKFKRHSLRHGFGMVLQDTWLKSGTILENIIMGKLDATMDEVIDAAKKAHSYSFIRRLPKGFDTYITEDGGTLSQGQKQLLCITRVMLAVPPMLILDEATSSIDIMTEVRIGKAFDRLTKGRTSIVVAHRLSTIQSADIIIVMDKGKIIETGNHEELLAMNGYYSRLYESGKI